MQSAPRHRAFFGAAIMLLGLGCLNYTKMGQTDRHTEFAQHHGLPAPSVGITYMGMLLTPLGAGMFGYRLGKAARLRPTSPSAN